MAMHVDDERGSVSVTQEKPLLQQGAMSSRNGMKSNNIGSWSESYEEFISTWTLWGVRKPRKAGELINRNVYASIVNSY